MVRKESWTGETQRLAVLMSCVSMNRYRTTEQPLLRLLFLLPISSNRDRSPPRGGYRTRDQQTMIKVGPTTHWGTTSLITDKSPNIHTKKKKVGQLHEHNTAFLFIYFCIVLHFFVCLSIYLYFILFHMAFEVNSVFRMYYSYSLRTELATDF